MKDLSSPEMQRIFKSVRRLDLCLYVVMLLIMISGISITIVGFTQVNNVGIGLNWAQILYIVMLAVTFVFAIAVLVLNLRTRGPYKNALCAYVSQGFEEYTEKLVDGKNVEISLYLVGDKLAVTKQGLEDVIFFDLTSVKKFYNVCAHVTSLVKKYLTALYCANCANSGNYSVTVTDATFKKPKIIKVVENGAPTKDITKNPFVKSGYIKKEAA